MELLRYIIFVLFLASGLSVAAIAVFGLFKFKFVMNRMHAAALCDTLALLLVLLGVAVLFGASYATLKIGLIIVFLWIASPVSSHLIALLEVTINHHLEDDCDTTGVEEKEEQ